MKLLLATALLLASPAFTASAAPVAEPVASVAQPAVEGLTRLARDSDRDDEGRRRHHRDRDDDEDEDEGHHRHHRHNDHHDHHGDHDDHDGDRAGNRAVDPNPTNAPVPDNGVFGGKTRPKVEVK
jgi:ABC-type nickel/cobalt efflux system permease component RcnA